MEQPKRQTRILVETADAIWQLELTCFEIVTPGQNYMAQFGEFRVDTIKDLTTWDNKLKSIETGDE